MLFRSVCYAKFIKFAPHPIKRVEIPFGNGKSLPAYLHLPRKPVNGEKFPIVFSCGGMDGSKENMVSLYGDRFMERGIAVLAIDGPGQAEAVSRGIYFSPENWEKCANAVYDFLSQQPNIDIKNLVIRGSSFGSFWGTVAAATLGSRVKAFVTTIASHLMKMICSTGIFSLMSNRMDGLTISCAVMKCAIR